MALALADVGCADEMRKVAPRMAEQIREAISAQRGRKGVFCPEALQVCDCCMFVWSHVPSVEDWLHPPAVHCEAIQEVIIAQRGRKAAQKHCR